MYRSLPVESKLEEVEKEARKLLHEVRRGNPVAVARWHSLDSEARTLQARTADMQYLIAREYGFKSWRNLKECLNRNSSHPGPIGPT
jgi:hypothetical protein